MSDEAGTAPGLAGAGGPVGAASAPVQLAVSTVILALRPDEAAAGVAEAGAAGTGGEAADAAASASDTGAAGAGSAAADGRLRLWLPLVRRIRAPYRGLFALPGGPLPPELSLEEAAADWSVSGSADAPTTPSDAQSKTLGLTWTNSTSRNRWIFLARPDCAPMRLWATTRQRTILTTSFSTTATER